MLAPAAIYGLLFLGQRFPVTECVAGGVSHTAMFREALRPAFLILLFCMFLTASTELTPNQWVAKFLQDTAGLQEGILVLVFINFIMFGMRFFAGPISHRVSPIGLLFGCSALSLIGLYALSFAHTAATAFLTAGVFAVGISFFWPTMLGVTSERFPVGGAFLLALMGAGGNISVGTTNPIFGKIYGDVGAATAFRFVAIFPAILIVVFGVMWLSHRTAGGYRPVELNSEPAPESVEA